VADFASRYPAVRFELNFDDRRIDLVAEGYDVAVRIAQLADTSLIARKLGAVRTRTVASPAYVEAHGTPVTPHELAQHECLVVGLDGAGSTWRFSGERELAVKVRPRLAVSSVEGLVAPALAGLGIARIPEAVLCEEIRLGKLVAVLADWDSRVPVHAVYPPGRNQSPKVRRFVDHLVHAFAGAPWACG
jgi:DNA-binding transcriptional LysR family regulator